MKKIYQLIFEIIIASFMYIKLIEKRSYKSFLLEVYISLLNKLHNSGNNEKDYDKMLNNYRHQEFDETVISFKTQVNIDTVNNCKIFKLNNQKEKQDIVLYVHGGAWYEDPVKSHFKYVDKLATTLNAKIVFPILPLIPENNYRVTFDLLEKVYLDILKDEVHQKIIIMGDSSGGQIALSFAQYLKEKTLQQPEHIVLISPVLDSSFSNPEAKYYETFDPMLEIAGGQYIAKKWSGDLPLIHYKISPLYGAFENLGKITLSIGTKDLLYPDVMKLSKKLTNLDIEHHLLIGYQLFHVYQLFDIPEQKLFLKQLKNIIKEER